ncbi:kinase binding protein CGI-121-domain-containing protein [Baffinella frigidus]|nr:kinase binding protein CGI-121-domain-containing protein [Cryptophyta sp. CCMP2293]|mmetsp:Transcript_60553/g.143458  ORF Transcript_60553/g.143458 Transcript_60553/m.143458 type:complete len:184 (-) Transcript_60553:81-632(-)
MAASEDGGHAEVLQFELFPSHKMTVCLVEDVENAAELRAEVLQQKFDASFLDAAMISDIFQLHAAANKALYALSKDALTTHGIHTEVIFSLSGAKSITAALSTFGIANTSKHLLVAMIDAEPAAVEETLSQVKGTRVALSRLPDFSDATRIKKAYKIGEEEMALPAASIADGAVCRIAIRDSA